MSDQISRRESLKLLGAAAAMGAGPAFAQESKPFLTRDIGTLETALVHLVSENDNVVNRLDDGALPRYGSDREAAVVQQQTLLNLMREGGVNLINLTDALGEAIQATRRSGVFETWVRAHHPRLMSLGTDITVDVLLGRDPKHQFSLGPDGNFRRSAPATGATMWVRDSAFMTPNGLVIAHAASHWRAPENDLLGFVYRHSPLLRDFPIIFDAVEEGYVIEGGDAQVVDRNTLYLGVGYRTDPRIAPVLARRLNMDVLTVQSVKADFLKRGAETSAVLQDISTGFLHLDTYCTHVADQHALTMPFVFERDYVEDSPPMRFIRGARVDLRLDADDATDALELFRALGRVRLFRRGTGREEPLEDGLKLVDYLKANGYRITFVGGERPDGAQEQFRHFMRYALPELRRQAANVMQIRTGEVLAFDDAPKTAAALRNDGLEVKAFHARQLWDWHGGPHCLVQPLRRA